MGCETAGADGVSVTNTIAGVRVGVGVGLLVMQPAAASASTAMISNKAGSSAPDRRLLCVGKRLIGSILPSGCETDAQYIIPVGISQRQPAWGQGCCRVASSVIARPSVWPTPAPAPPVQVSNPPSTVRLRLLICTCICATGADTGVARKMARNESVKLLQQAIGFVKRLWNGREPEERPAFGETLTQAVS